MLIEILAFIPFVLLLVLMVGFRMPAIKSVPISLIVLLLLSFFFWKIYAISIGAATIKGIFTAIEIMLIVFGAVLLLATLENTKQLATIQGFLSSINPDARIQIILIAWLFGSLIEGVAGFGTPAAIAAPLLVSAGFNPIISVAAALISDSLSVSFGAVGVPITLGLGSLGFSPETLASVTKMTALIHSLAGIIVPLSLVYLTISQARKSKKQFFEAVPFALFCWIVFVAIYFPTAYFLGPELPSILAGFGSLIICGFAAKKRFLQPKSEICFAHHHKKINSSPIKILKAISPYLVIIAFLLLSRTLTPFKKILTSISLGMKDILGTNASYNFLPLYTPAFIFILASLIFALAINERKQIPKSFLQAFHKVKKPTIALIFTLIFVQILILSGANNSGLPAFQILLANTIVGIFKSFYVFVAPLIGAIGAFIAGSNTVSNLLFATIQAEAATSIGAPLVLLLALQVIGGAIGNMFAIHNVLAAEATVRLHNKEGEIIRKIIVVSSIYAILAGIIGMIIFHFF